MSLTREAVDGFCTEGGSFHISWNVIVDADGEVHPVGNDRRCLQCASQTGHVADNARFFLADVMTIDWPNRGQGILIRRYKIPPSEGMEFCYRWATTEYEPLFKIIQVASLFFLNRAPKAAFDTINLFSG
ncbi:MAG: hypothetical protein A2Y28_04675 [Chlamydiae bacterium GWC2_50_10]|nr:MAG: hypothetical protein A2Y28_04675 [Chlamydiae bacterium GWC2_50_10]OGN58847.1 MAG: hypothetical protein A3D18_01420 [Chlamydiae bacterium RIFCSPHIGHO2_02_FULL_49_29]OGN62733.1 MAG: hypothetical protein A3E26_05935 [Chlamydiae bacterium RIFCSPHIGHO2_12_FULL_49_32]